MKTEKVKSYPHSGLLLTTPEAAVALSVSTVTIKRLRSSGRGPTRATIAIERAQPEAPKDIEAPAFVRHGVENRMQARTLKSQIVLNR